MKEILSITPESVTQKQHKPQNIEKISRNLLVGTSLGLIIALAMMPRMAGATPTGSHVAQGNAAVLTTNKTTTINQISSRAVIDWKNFNLAADEKVIFNLPNNQAATLNNISGARSQIDGTVTSNGTLYFVNKNGFVFGATSNVTAANVIISTQEIDRSQFFTDAANNVANFGDINPTANITLNGVVEAQNNGVIAVFGPKIETGAQAQVLAHHGDIVLAAGFAKNVNFGGAGAVRFEMENPDSHSYSTKIDTTKFPGYHSPFNYTLQNAGKVESSGGHITLTANGLVENTGTIDSRPSENKTPSHDSSEQAVAIDGTVALISTHGIISLGKDKPSTIYSGFLNFNQGQDKADININDDFLRRIDFKPGKTLTFTSGHDILVRAELHGSASSKFAFKAAEGIYVLAPIYAGGVTMAAKYFEAHAAIKTDRDGLSITTTAQKWFDNNGSGKVAYGIWLDGDITAQNGGDITLVAQNGGRVKLNKDVSGNNISITTNNANLDLTGASLTATSQDAAAGKITLTLNGKGDLRVDNAITGNNLVVNSNNGSQEYFGKIDIVGDYVLNGGIYVAVKTGDGSIKFHDTLGGGTIRVSTKNGGVTFDKPITVKTREIKFDNEADRVNEPNVPPSGVQGGVLAVNSGGEVIFNEGVEFNSRTYITHYFPGAVGGLNVAKKWEIDTGIPELSVTTNERAKFRSAVTLHEGGWMRVKAKNIEYTEINAKKANISLTMTNSWADFSYKASWLDLNDKIDLSQAQSAYFDVMGDINISKPIEVVNLTLNCAKVNFTGNGKISGQEGGSVTISQHKNFDGKGSDIVVNEEYWKHFVGMDNAHLTLETDSSILVSTQIGLGQGKNFTLTAPDIRISGNHNIDINGGKFALNFTDSNQNHTVDLNQVGINQLVFRGDASLEVRSDNNLNITGTLPKFASADFNVSGRGYININTPITASQHLGFYTHGSILLNQRVAVDKGIAFIKFYTPDNNKYLFVGTDGRVGN